MADERITSVSQGVRTVYLGRKGFFVLVTGAFVLALVGVVAAEVAVGEEVGFWVQIVAVAAAFLLFAGVRRMVFSGRAMFWRHFAEDHGLAYQRRGDASLEQAAMLHRHHGAKVGDLSPAIIENVVSGTVEGRPARVFEMRFARGYGRERDWFYFTVIEFAMRGRFPHIFLNRLGAGYREAVSGRERIFISEDFAKKFELVAARKYEQEALEIFTPAVLRQILEMDHPHDVEIVDGELLMFREGLVQNRADLEREFEIAKRLLGVLAPRLDRMHYEKIGDMSDSLR